MENSWREKSPLYRFIKLRSHLEKRRKLRTRWPKYIVKLRVKIPVKKTFSQKIEKKIFRKNKFATRLAHSKYTTKAIRSLRAMAKMKGKIHQPTSVDNTVKVIPLKARYLRNAAEAKIRMRKHHTNAIRIYKNVFESFKPLYTKFLLAKQCRVNGYN